MLKSIKSVVLSIFLWALHARIYVYVCVMCIRIWHETIYMQNLVYGLGPYGVSTVLCIVQFSFEIRIFENEANAIAHDLCNMYILTKLNFTQLNMHRHCYSAAIWLFNRSANWTGKKPERNKRMNGSANISSSNNRINKNASFVLKNTFTPRS